MSKLVAELVAVVWLSLIAMRFPTWAQLPEGWEVQLEQLTMNVKGFDEHVGDIVRETAVFAISPVGFTTKMERQPINIHMQSANTFRGELKYRRQGWGVGVSGWFFSTEDSIRGRVTTPEPIFTPTSVTFFSNSVSMWNETLGPVTNELEPSEAAPVDFHADADLSGYTVSLFALRPLHETDGSRLELVAGAKLGQVETRQAHGFADRAFIFDFFARGVHFNNQISLDSTAEAEFRGAGPVVGLQGQNRWRRLGIQASATQSVLIGDADQQGIFIDIDDITVAQSPTGPFLPCPVQFIEADCVPFHGEIHFSNTERVFLPVTELRLNLEFEITRNIAVGGTGFAAIWSNTPVPPTFTLTHAFAAGAASPGLNWAQEERTLRFAGAGVALQIRF